MSDGYDNKYDLMDQKVFPNNSHYIFKENPKASAMSISRIAKSDADIIAAVTAEMVDTLGAEVES